MMKNNILRQTVTYKRIGYDGTICNHTIVFYHGIFTNADADKILKDAQVIKGTFKIETEYMKG